MEINTALLCKDCIHARINVLDKIFTLNGRVGSSNDTMYKCSKFPEEAKVVDNPVTGKEKIKASLPFCSLVRKYGDCGTNGKYWTSKRKKDLFKMLTKDYND